MKLVNYADIVPDRYYVVYNHESGPNSYALLAMGEIDRDGVLCNSCWKDSVLVFDESARYNVYKDDTFYELDDDEVLRYIVMENL